MTRKAYIPTFLYAAFVGLCLLSSPIAAQAQANFITKEQTAPPAPRTVNVYLRPASLQVGWTDVESANIIEYKIFRFETTAPDTTLVLVKTVSRGQGTPVMWYNDTMVVPGVNYTYFVTAQDAFGNQSANSPMASGATIKLY